MKQPSLVDELKALLAKNELEKVIDLLSKNFADNDQLDQLILQSGQFHALKKDQQKGVMDYGEQQKYFNQFRSNILDFVNDLPEVKIVDEQEGKKQLKANYQLAKARINILTVLLEITTAETISKIYQLSNIKQRKLVVQCLNELTEVGYIEKKKIGSNVYWQLTDSGIPFAKSFI